MSDNGNTDHYQRVILEEIRDELKAVQEAVAPIPEMRKDIAELKADMHEVTSDLKIMKAVATEHATALLDHEKRLTKLERKTA